MIIFTPLSFTSCLVSLQLTSFNIDDEAHLSINSYKFYCKQTNLFAMLKQLLGSYYEKIKISEALRMAHYIKLA